MLQIAFILMVQLSVTLCEKNSYIGAVVEYAPINSYDLPSPMEVTCTFLYSFDLELSVIKVLAANIDQYLGFMAEANRMGGDIIVFPEYGVTGVGLSEEGDREVAREFMVVGEVGRNYCAGEYVNNNDELMEMIGCGARNNNIYVLVNIGEMVNCTEAQVLAAGGTLRIFISE